jgi:hypothetical protein
VAVDLSAVTMDRARTRAVNLNSTGSNVVEVSLPVGCRSIDVFFTNGSGSAHAGKIADSGTDGAAESADAMIVPSGALYNYPVSTDVRAPAAPKVYLSGHNNGIAHLVLIPGRPGSP